VQRSRIRSANPGSRDKVDDALEVTELSESDVYEIEKSEYVRKAEVDETRPPFRWRDSPRGAPERRRPSSHDDERAIAGSTARVTGLTASQAVPSPFRGSLREPVIPWTGRKYI